MSPFSYGLGVVVDSLMRCCRRRNLDSNSCMWSRMEVLLSIARDSSEFSE